MMQAILLAPILLSVATGGKMNRPNPVERPEPSTLPEITWSTLYEDANEDSDSTWEAPLLGGGTATNYCQATMNSFGTTASIGWVGSLTLSDNTFGLSCNGAAAIQNSWGIFTYGPNQFNTPFGNGYLCISPFPPGIYKMRTQHLLNGNVVRRKTSHPSDFLLFTPSSTWNFQFWYRDPPAGGANFNLSDGLQVTFGP
jgi:hypothetical protein